MDIGLNIAEGVRVRIGDKIGIQTETMDKNGIDYSIPYKDDKDKNNVSMVMFMEKCGVELNIINDVIVYIKSNNSESNYVMQVSDEMSPVQALLEVRKHLAENFNIGYNDIRIDKFDSNNLNSTLSIPISSVLKAKIELIMGAHKKLYMQSIGLTS